MKKLNNILPILAIAATAIVSCAHFDEEPPVNKGYKSTIRVPDAEELKQDDLDLINKQQEDYDANKNKI